MHGLWMRLTGPKPAGQVAVRREPYNCRTIRHRGTIEPTLDQPDP